MAKSTITIPIETSKVTRQRNEKIEEILKNNPLFPYNTGLHHDTMKVYVSEGNIEIEGVYYQVFLDRWGRRGRPDTMIYDSMPQIVEALNSDKTINQIAKNKVFESIKGAIK